MKKLILPLMLVLSSLVACASSDNNSTNSLVDDQNTSDNASDLISSDVSSLPEYSNVINANQLVSLIMDAPYADLNIVASSETNLDIYGQENGIRYHQTQSFKENTYSNDITIGKGTVNHYYVNNPSSVYESDFTLLRVLQDEFYYDITMYDSDDFTSTTDAVNLMLTSDIVAAREEARCYVSSGIGVEAYEDFILGYNMGATIYFSSEFIGDDLSVTIYMNYESSSTNQYYLATFSYLFDINDSHIKNYIAEQAYYSLLAYQANNYSIEGLTPIDYIKQETITTVGTLVEYTEELPFDIDSLFVKEIILSAATTEIKVGEEVALKARILPETAIDKSLVFDSSDKTIATVDSRGRVKGLTPGTCTITAENIYSGAIGEIEITVLQPDKPDPGDDTKKGDLSEALSAVINQVFSTPTYVIENGSLEYSSVGMVIDGEQSISSEGLATLSVSDFAYNENLRRATYVGDMEKLESIIPFFDNGIEDLSNRYLIKNNNSIYREVIVSFELVLGATNTIDYIKVVGRTDSISTNTKIDTENLNNDNVDSIGELTINQYTKNIYYESRGFVYE